MSNTVEYSIPLVTRADVVKALTTLEQNGFEYPRSIRADKIASEYAEALIGFPVFCLNKVASRISDRQDKKIPMPETFHLMLAVEEMSWL